MKGSPGSSPRSIQHPAPRVREAGSPDGRICQVRGTERYSRVGWDRASDLSHKGRVRAKGQYSTGLESDMARVTPFGGQIYEMVS
ncbi:hypothetical protein GONAM_30_00470 [Gordonia namibiensis NBRC 108229]|uniref:Uncharacterized protein n=1 Tax=Gordonia namibiensis NBRC 108229 TaxID=1208314 RepID=K6XB60_9ACTN|nr:hypothetical protein GONAM_30_00470 [Gordonia namibiensis NBRC 108229]